MVGWALDRLLIAGLPIVFGWGRKQGQLLKVYRGDCIEDFGHQCGYYLFK